MLTFFISLLLQNLLFKCFSTKLYTMLDYIPIRHRTEIFSFCNPWKSWQGRSLKLILWVLWSATYFVFWMCYPSEKTWCLPHQVHQLIDLYEHPGIFNPQIKQHFCIASCRLMTCVCCYTLPLQSPKFKNIYMYFWLKKHKQVLSYSLHELNKCCLHVPMLSKCRCGPDKIHQLIWLNLAKH